MTAKFAEILDARERELADILDAGERQFAEGSVKVHVTFSAGEVGVGGEAFWSKPYESADTFVINNVPFFTDVPTFGDVVRAVPDPPGQRRWFEFVEVVTRSDWQPYVAVAGEPGLEALIAHLRRSVPSQDDLRMEGGFQDLLAIVVRSEKESDVLDALDSATELGLAVDHA